MTPDQQLDKLVLDLVDGRPIRLADIEAARRSPAFQRLREKYPDPFMGPVPADFDALCVPKSAQVPESKPSPAPARERRHVWGR